MKEGFISTLQSYSTKDGPGIRTTVFCIGCNLRCAWCANPELMLPGEKTCILNNAVSGAVPASNTAMVKYPWQKMDA